MNRVSVTNPKRDLVLIFVSIVTDKPSFIAEVNAINDVNTLRQMLIQKERDRQSIANDLDVAARLGLVISETNEAIQIKVCLVLAEDKTRTSMCYILSVVYGSCFPCDSWLNWNVKTSSCVKNLNDYRHIIHIQLHTVTTHRDSHLTNMTITIPPSILTIILLTLTILLTRGQLRKSGYT